MEEKKNNNFIWTIGGIILLIILLISVANFLENKKELDVIAHERELIQEGKVEASEEIVREIAEILKNREEDALEQYLTEDFSYWKNGETQSIDDFWNDLNYLVENKYSIEERENSIEDEETWFIYWNTNESITDKSSDLYCLQEIRIYLKRVVEEEFITYKIERIILNNK